MTTVNITFTTSIDGVANWNEVTGQGTTGQKIADLLDDSGASTGLSLWVTTAFTNSFFSSSIATAAAHGIPEIVWDQVWYSDGSAAFEIRGFSAGQTGTIDLAGAGGKLREILTLLLMVDRRFFMMQPEQAHRQRL